MKRIFPVLLIAVFFITSGLSAQDFSVSITGNYLAPADEGYKDIYGSGVFFPELKLAYDFGGLGVWASFGMLSASGETPNLQAPADSSQQFLSAGLGYKFDASAKMHIKIQAGVLYVNYKEEALEIEETGNTVGFRTDLDLEFDFSSSFFGVLTLGYLYGTDTVNPGTPLEVDIKLGGLKAGAGIGIRF